MAGVKLANALRELQEQSAKRLPAEIREKMQQAIQELEQSGIAHGLSVGDRALDFTLKDTTGKEITLYEELKKGPVVLTFYRGEWCPYCNMELRAYQQVLNQIRAAGAQLIAISPQTPDHSLSMKQKNELEFYVLSDVGNKVAEQYRLVYILPEYLQEIYKNLGLDLTKYNHDHSWTLPISATYVIDQNGIIRAKEADADYKKRMEPSEVVSILKQL